MFEATGAVGANAAAAASQAVTTPTARRIAHTPSPVPQKLELVETKVNKTTKKKKEKQFENCREFGMKIHISYFLLPGTEFSFPSVVLPNLSTKKLGREIQRDGRYNASGVRGGREGRRAWKLARARLRSTAGGLKKPAVGTAHRRAPLRLVPPSSTFSIF